MDSICKFHLKGRCRYGERCRNPHSAKQVRQREEAREMERVHWKNCIHSVHQELTRREMERVHWTNRIQSVHEELIRRYHPMGEYQILIQARSHGKGHYYCHRSWDNHRTWMIAVPQHVQTIKEFEQEIETFRPKDEPTRCCNESCISWWDVEIKLIQVHASYSDYHSDDDSDM